MKTCTRPRAKIAASTEHVDAFKALSHLSRLRVFFFVVHAAREVNVGQIQAALAIPGPTLSHQLEILRRAGLLESRRQERFIYYSARPVMVTALVRLLSACC